MGKIITSLEQVPDALTIILDKMEKMEMEMASIKQKYSAAPPLPVEQDELITFQEALQFLKIQANALHRWKREGLVPYSKIGTRVYFKKADLENYNRVEINKKRRF